MSAIPFISGRQLTSRGWKPALWHAVPISSFILGLFYYWFAVADRYAIFLYGHRNALPFEEPTTSRYWMSGLVACGVVMMAYILANWLLGRWAARQRRTYRAPAWEQVWLASSVPLAIGIPAITMTVNQPTLPPLNAIACVAATLAGLAIALAPGAWAAERPRDLIWLGLDGMGLMPALLLLHAVELPSRGIGNSRTAYLAAIGGTLAGVAWLGVMTGLRAWRRKSPPKALALWAAGLGLSYLVMPVVHHLLFTPAEYRYISTAANFFAFDPGVQLMVFAVAAALAVGATRLRQRLHQPINSEDIQQ
jgi:uncharacterized membrane protein YidH (DUF202 family)